MPYSSSIRPRRHHGHALWPVLLFAVGVVALLVLISSLYLLPALDAARHADPAARRHLAAYSRLLLAVTLCLLLFALILLFRIRRFFVPTGDQRTPTQYIDAWAESAKRIQTPPAVEDDTPSEPR